MRRIVWARAARNDLERIRRFIAKDNPRAAERMVGLLEAAGEALTDFPDRGLLVRGTLRKLTTVRPYLIFYRVLETGVHILHIRHGARAARSTDRPKQKAPDHSGAFRVCGRRR